jgi:microcystin synthetase protein McyE
VEAFATFCEKNSIKSHILDATHAFHSRAMDPILKEYESVAKSITYRPSKIKFISGVDGKKIENVDADYWVINNICLPCILFILNYLQVRHTREGVQFSKATISCFQDGEAAPLFLEVGPHPVLSALVHANAPTNATVKCFPSMRKPPTNKTSNIVESTEWQTILDTLCKLHVAGIVIDFQKFHSFHPKNKVKLPFYPFQRKMFWMTSDHCTISKSYFHPLLGSKISLPKTPDHDIFDSTRQTRFQNFVTLKTTK